MNLNIKFKLNIKQKRTVVVVLQILFCPQLYL